MKLEHCGLVVREPSDIWVTNSWHKFWPLKSTALHPLKRKNHFCSLLTCAITLVQALKVVKKTPPGDKLWHSAEMILFKDLTRGDSKNHFCCLLACAITLVQALKVVKKTPPGDKLWHSAEMILFKDLTRGDSKNHFCRFLVCAIALVQTLKVVKKTPPSDKLWHWAEMIILKVLRGVTRNTISASFWSVPSPSFRHSKCQKKKKTSSKLNYLSRQVYF